MVRFYLQLSSSKKIYISTALGLLIGLFFGSRCEALEILNTLFIKLFQIAIIPYMIFSIIHAISSMSFANAKLVGKHGGKILIFLWGLTILFALILSLSFPDIQRYKFYSAEDENIQYGEMLFELFVPTNPFHSISRGAIPAIVIFCVLMGIALMEEENKSQIVKGFKTLASVMNRINSYLMKLLPLGVLVTSSYTFGTISYAKFQTVILYALAAVIYLVFMSMLIYPLFIKSSCNFTYRKFLHFSIPAALIAFTTGSVFIALPVIYELMYKFAESHEAENSATESEDAKNIIGFVVPMAWLVPATYKFLVVFFVVFTYWYYNRTIDIFTQLYHYIFSIPCLFGSNSAVLPFLLDILNLPNRAYNMFMMVSNFLVYFNNANGAMFIVTLTMLSYMSMRGSMKIRWGRLSLVLIPCAVLFGLIMYSLNLTMKHALSKDVSIKEELMHMNVSTPAEGEYNAMLLSENKQIKPLYLSLNQYHNLSKAYSEEPLLDMIMRTKVLQVGYDPMAPPFSFFNVSGTLVGYDVDFIFDIANKLDCSIIEFYAVFGQYHKLIDQETDIAIVIGGNGWNPPVKGAICSDPYMELIPAVIFPAKYKHKYKDFMSVIKSDDLTGCVRSFNDVEYLAGQKIKGIDTHREFLIDHVADVLVTSAECAEPMNILYPNYWVYEERSSPSYYAYLLQYKPYARSFNDFINTWITMYHRSGKDQQLYKYWIKGESLERTFERWSILDWVLSKIGKEVNH